MVRIQIRRIVVKKLTPWVLLALTIAQAAPAQDIAAGEKIFKKCAGCHRIGDGAKNAVGPVLNNVIGRAAGSFEGYKYGKGMKEAGAKGLIWDADKIAAYLVDPKKYLRAFTGNKKAKAKMKFKLKDAQKRLDVLAYIATFSDSEVEPASDMTHGSGMIPAPTDIKATEICVQNAGKTTYFFAVDGGGDNRKTGMLDPGATLCTDATEMATKGKVSVFEKAENVEGCTRIIPLGHVEQMRRYSEFDRCLWSSNDS